jgi:hypothetical protein
MSSFCFYIPSISAITSAKDVTREFNYIGVVTRVDFAPLGKKPGFQETVSTDTKSAFVHMGELFAQGRVIESCIKMFGSYKLHLSPISSEFWTLLKANNPVQGTMMNTSQIVANCRYLENIVKKQATRLEEQATQLEQQAADIRALNEKLTGVHTVVYQLLGGLFCQKSQAQIMSEHVEYLYPDDSSTSSRSRFGEPDDSKWTIWPTTRQGDDCERRIADLEADLDAAINAINQHAEKGIAADEKIKELEQQVKELTIEAVFTPYEEDKYGNMEMYELQADDDEADDEEDDDEADDEDEEDDDDEDEEDEEDEDDEHTLGFVPIPMEQMIEQHNYDESHSLGSYSISTHSSMPELIYGDGTSVPDLESLTDDDDEVGF